MNLYKLHSNPEELESYVGFGAAAKIMPMVVGIVEHFKPNSDTYFEPVEIDLKKFLETATPEDKEMFERLLLELKIPYMFYWWAVVAREDRWEEVEKYIRKSREWDAYCWDLRGMIPDDL